MTTRTTSMIESEALRNDFEQRLSTQHQLLNERLELKDRWITDRFHDIEHRIEILNEATLERNGSALIRAKADTEALRSEVNSLHSLIEQEFKGVLDRFEDNKLAAQRAGQLIIDGHMQMHATADRSLDEFKVAAQLRLDVLVKAIEIMREERALFVLRDAYDTQTDILEKSLDSLERVFTEKLEAVNTQSKDSFDQKISVNSERITKLEQNLQVMNARNQQSIIALGILLTLVEIIIRFYNG